MDIFHWLMEIFAPIKADQCCLLTILDDKGGGEGDGQLFLVNLQLKMP